LALQEFIRRTRAELGDRIERIVLYGSRARGDYDEDSDVDVLVFVRNSDGLEGIRETLQDLAWEITEDYNHSFFIQRWVYTEDDFKKDASYFLIRNVKREGVTV